MLLQLPSTLTLENSQVVFDSAPFLQYGLNTSPDRGRHSGGAADYGNDGGPMPWRACRFRGKGLAMALIMVQIIIPADVLILPNYTTLRQLGLLDASTCWA